MVSTPKIVIPTSMKNLINKKITKTFKFMGEDITVSKLTVGEVIEIQEQAKALKDDDTSGLDLLRKVIRIAVKDAAELSDEDFNSFPMEELSTLSNNIMKFSGMLPEGK